MLEEGLGGNPQFGKNIGLHTNADSQSLLHRNSVKGVVF
jgi:hypothetical protein